MTKNLQYVVFALGKELYGLGINSVREIVRVPEVTEIPDAPAFLEGVINLRGRVMPVIDLRKRLRLNTAQRTKATRVLVIENDAGSGGFVGFLVDSISEVRKIQPEAVEEPPEMVSAVGVEYITGVARVDERLIILLDLKKILSIEDMKKTGASLEGESGAKAA